ncbi:MAG TPA: methylated-DNA--[protein]-cysteine S-methyltransferase [Steroidobacteraceae bacterium]|jgi:methylated-DNA-[protein]-cysteine S-methyltransferase
MQLLLSRIPSPLDEILLVSDAQGLVRALDFSDYEARMRRLLREHYGTYQLVDGPAPAAVAAALSRYFDGDLAALQTIDTATAGSDLQRRVWKALREIPVGKTVSYGELARELGFQDPRAAIDVGAANRVNPIAIIVPCHRVVATGGDLKGYAGGVHRKRWLLQHEGALAKTTESFEALRLPGF